MKSKTSILLNATLLIATLAFALPAFAQTEVGIELPAVSVAEFPTAVNETTLTILVVAGITAAIITNIEGYNKKATADENWSFQKFLPTFVYTMLAGVGTGVGLTTFLEVDVGTSIIKGFVLYALATFVAVAIERARQK